MTSDSTREPTDIALELADLCDELCLAVAAPGDEFLEDKFQVDKWSPDFFAILFAIVNRTQQLEKVLEAEKVSQPVMNQARRHLSAIRSAFDRDSMRHNWKDRGATLVGSEHSGPIRLMSGIISRNHSFDRPTDEDVDTIREMVSELLVWLKERQIDDRDFIRECLIEGLEQFDFRVSRLTWFGWGYSLQSLKDVIMAYFALERGLVPSENPDIAAIIQKVGVTLKKLYKLTGAAKDVVEDADWALSFARVAIRAGSSGGTFIAGYLTGS